MFVGLGWEKEMKSLRDPHIAFNPSPERDRCVAKQYSDDYQMT